MWHCRRANYTDPRVNEAFEQTRGVGIDKMREQEMKLKTSTVSSMLMWIKGKWAKKFLRENNKFKLFCKVYLQYHVVVYYFIQSDCWTLNLCTLLFLRFILTQRRFLTLNSIRFLLMACNLCWTERFFRSDIKSLYGVRKQLILLLIINLLCSRCYNIAQL